MTGDIFHPSHAAPPVDGGELLVELPSRHLAESLCDRLGPGFFARLEEEEDVWVVDIRFGGAGALARLLRMVETWVAERALGAVRHHLDGKAYILSAGEIAWSSFGCQPVLL